MQKLHIISHTHWDREWYRTFQQFRLKLVHLVDNLLTILDNDPTYQHFMLDGQAIVLEDYLQMRMVNLPRLQNYIQGNRILIGPWYILPDEFLVSPEATIRNLLIGKQVCGLFGQRMMVGYIPDPFGHISQLPQIFNGFHMDTACLWRGVKDGTPTLVTWQAPDGSQVLLAHLYNGYGNIADWPLADEDDSLAKLDNAADFLEPHNPTSQYLMMRGTDHFEPRPTLPEHIRYYNAHNQKDRRAIHSTLPAYLAAVTDELEEKNIQLEMISGELRDPKKAHMLPGVLSARMWIKQRNFYAQTLLERWVEPFTTWAELQTRGNEAFLPITAPLSTDRIADPGSIIHQAWKLLIENHPHDSICGCSIDATHDDMFPRFDQVDQVGEELTRQSLNALTAEVTTSSDAENGEYAAITVFNAAPYAKTDLLEVFVDMPDGWEGVKTVDEDGNDVPCVYSLVDRELKESNYYTYGQLMEMLASVALEGHNAQTLVSAQLVEEDDRQIIEADFSSVLPANLESLAGAFTALTRLVENAEPGDRIQVRVFNVQTAKLSFVAEDVPAFGYKTYWLAEDEYGEYNEDLPTGAKDKFPEGISNEFFKISIEGETGSLTLTDNRTHRTYRGLNAIYSVGDRGDEYNFTPPENDESFQPLILNSFVIKTRLIEYIYMQMSLEIPKGLTEERDERSDDFETCMMDVLVSLTAGVPAVDVTVNFDNQGMDHRLEVRFPTGLMVDTARYDGHFHIVERAIDLTAADDTWRELPRPEVPQRAFADVSDNKSGLMIANRGLPEVATLRGDDGRAVIALTLLRSVGWLSRDDLWNRQDHAGPPLETPGAQELGEYTFKYRIIPHEGDFLEAAKLAHTFQTDFEPRFTSLHEGQLDSAGSMIEVSSDVFHVTAIKEAENEAGYIVRGVNLSDKTIHVKLTSRMLAVKAALVNLDESEVSGLELSAEGGIELDVAPWKIVSVFFGIVE